MKTDGGEIPFCEGTVVAMPPKCRHGSLADSPYRNVCVHTDLPLFGNKPLVVPAASKALKTLFSAIAELYFENRENSSVIAPLIVALKELIAKELDAPLGDDELAFVHSEISKNFNNAEFDLNALIESTGYTEDYFRVKFKVRYGVTPKGWLDELRMRAAKDLARVYGNALTVAEISESCGYWDPLYFSRKFKKTYGVSPKNYIQSIER